MKILVLTALLNVTMLFAQATPYKIYSSKGKEVNYNKMLNVLKQNDVVLFGELHNNSMAHYLQIKVAKSIFENKKLVIGAEMFEIDQNVSLQRYLRKEIDAELLGKEIKLWSNFTTDYKPLVDFAQQNNIDYVATNVPRRYASLLYKKGISALDSLPDLEKKWMAPLPFPYDKNLPSYVKMMDMFKDSNHANENFPKSQALKDATMAYFITNNLKVNSVFLHLNGSYHSDYHEGIAWYLKKYNENLKVATITVVEQDNVNFLSKEHFNKADFVIVVDSDVNKSY